MSGNVLDDDHPGEIEVYDVGIESRGVYRSISSRDWIDYDSNSQLVLQMKFKDKDGIKTVGVKFGDIDKTLPVKKENGKMRYEGGLLFGFPIEEFKRGERRVKFKLTDSKNNTTNVVDKVKIEFDEIQEGRLVVRLVGG